MKAMQINKADQGPVLVLVELQTPEPAMGEILSQVHAAGVTPDRIALVPHDAHEIRNSAHSARYQGTNFREHRGDWQRCPRTSKLATRSMA